MKNSEKYFFQHLFQCAMHTICLIVFVMPAPSYAQETATIEWSQCYGGSRNENEHITSGTSPLAGANTKIVPSPGGGYLFAGTTPSMDGDIDISQRKQDEFQPDSFRNVDIWLVKLSEVGLIEWQRCYGGSRTDIVYDLKKTRDGGYVICGSTASNDGDFTRDVPPLSSDHFDGFVMKLDAAGRKEWMSLVGGSRRDVLRSVIQVADGGYAAVGNTDSHEESWNNLPWINHPWHLDDRTIVLEDGLFVRLRSDGAKLWNRLLGGTHNEIFHSLFEKTNGNFILCGTAHSIDGDVVARDSHIISQEAWVLELSNIGVMLWSRCYGGSLGDHFNNVYQTHDGNILLIGHTNSDDSDVLKVLPVGTSKSVDSDVWTVLLNAADREIINARCLGGSRDDYVSYTVMTSRNTIAFAGTTMSTDGYLSDTRDTNDVWFGELSQTGELLWNQCINGSNEDVAGGLSETLNGFIVSGSTRSNDGHFLGNHWGKYGPTHDIWVAKLSTVQSVASTSPQEVNFAYPNPSSGEVNLSIHSDARVKSVEFINPLGMKISAPYRLSGDILTAETATLSSGMYILEVSYENSTIPTERRKFLKE